MRGRSRATAGPRRPESVARLSGPMSPRAGQTRSQAKESPKGRALEVAGRSAGGGVTHTFAHRGELANGRIELVGFRGEHLPIDARPPAGGESAPDLVQREPREPPQRDESQPLEHVGLEDAPQASP